MTEPAAPMLRLPQPPAEDVFTATEVVRAADFPSVPPELLVAVLAAEQDNPDNRIAAARAVGREVDSWLAEHPDEQAAAVAGSEGEVAP